MRSHQVAWRSVPDNCICPKHGTQNGLTRKWILPGAKWEQSLWPCIRAGSANPLPGYLMMNSIQPHPGKHNLNSSWVQCEEFNCLRTTGLSDLETGWSSLFDSHSKVRFKVFTHQAWIAWVAHHGSPSVWQPWLNYVTARYGY